MIHQLDLAAKGIEIPAREIYNPDGPSLVDGVCRVGGGTGSFVSPQGLILTNHHVAFDGVQAVSTTDQDYLTKGFAAARLEDELPAKDYVCRITVGYRDVSSEILSAVDAGGDPIARGRAIMLRSRELVAAAEQENPGRKAAVSEMFQGSSYVLFLYQEIPDVRLVCVPPRAVGEYGGEDDNWIWPRHTGDFSFLRAYVGPDGNPAPFSRDNVPFQPRKHLMVEPRGVQEGDAVFLLGYPGRTYRHQSSWYIESEKSIRLPFYADLFREQIAYMNELSAKDAAVALALAPDIKGRANVRKNYDGKLLGISRLDLVAVRRAEEDELMEWLEADQARFRRYGDFMSEVKEAYEEELADG
ncbi:MAG: S46 family peptidase, partial [Salinibacterium sp.]|nr:S46 family peptidase [Salinibacterium sp.]